MSEDRGQSGGGMYRVDCEDCNLDEAYSQEGTAVGRRLAHIDVRGHRVKVIEA